MNLITVIRTCLHARLGAMHACARKAPPPFPAPVARGSRLRATWLSQPGNGCLRLRWQADDSQEPPSRWRAFLCFG